MCLLLCLKIDILILGSFVYQPTNMSTNTIMGEKSKLFLSSTEKESLRTTVPISIVHQWKLKPGDYIDWSWEIIKNEMVVIVRRASKK